jgi:hypothetical protein
MKNKGHYILGPLKNTVVWKLVGHLSTGEPQHARALPEKVFVTTRTGVVAASHDPAVSFCFSPIQQKKENMP